MVKGNISQEERFMARALTLARRGWGKVSPNPLVGAVIVKGERVLAEGYHRAYGEPHAEVVAIRSARESLQGARLYVNLEPCCHYGKTPPCTEAIIESGIAEVFVATLDPNPLVGGAGMKKLQEAGIKTSIGILEGAARALNERFFKFIQTGLPFVTLKLAQSLDGKIATGSGDSRWITSLPARRYAHRLRGGHEAILVGIGTIRQDDPQLTCRLQRGRNPLRVILDSRLSIPLGARVLQEQKAAKTIIFACRGADEEKIKALNAQGVEVLLFPPEEGGRVDIEETLRELGARGISSLLVEGGAQVAAAFWKKALVDKLLVFVAPKIVGGGGTDAFADLGVAKIEAAPQLQWLKYRRIGNDILLEGIPL